MNRTLFENGELLRPDGRFSPGSVLVDGDTITDVLAPGADVPDARIVDMAGRALIPGFVDSHIHLSALALKRLRCDLGGAVSAEDVVARLSGAAGTAGDGAVVGVDWDESTWHEPGFPTRDMLDGVATDRPVYARRICGHVGVANTFLLSRLDPPEEFVDRERGVLAEAAVEQANAFCRPPAEVIIPNIGEAIAGLHGLGITGIHDIVGTGGLEGYLEGVRRCAAPLRIDALLIGDPGEFEAFARRASDLDDSGFRPAGIKMFADGSLGGWTAALNAPYSDAQTIGDYLLDEDGLEVTLRRCCDRKITCAVHAIGDRALRTVLLGMSRFPSDTDLFRIEHAELAGWEERRLLGTSGICLAMQPNFVRNWQQPDGLYERRLGPQRWRLCNPFRTLGESGVEFMFGSDGMPPGPLYGIGGATAHPVEAERLTLEEALVAYTSAPSSRGIFRRNTGRISAGFLADMVLLSGDRRAGDPDRLTVEATYVGGKQVYQAAART